MNKVNFINRSNNTFLIIHDKNPKVGFNMIKLSDLINKSVPVVDLTNVIVEIVSSINCIIKDQDFPLSDSINVNHCHQENINDVAGNGVFTEEEIQEFGHDFKYVYSNNLEAVSMTPVLNGFILTTSGVMARLNVDENGLVEIDGILETDALDRRLRKEAMEDCGVAENLNWLDRIIGSIQHNMRPRAISVKYFSGLDEDGQVEISPDKITLDLTGAQVEDMAADLSLEEFSLLQKTSIKFVELIQQELKTFLGE